MFGPRHDQRIEALAEVPLFRGCPHGELERVASLADETSFPAGATLMRQGRLGHEAFVLLEGEATVAIDGTPVATLQPGDIVGEMALLEREPRVATVTATDDVRALVLTPNGFNAVLDASPTVTRRVMATLAHRLREIQAA
jgi:CRP/FNR family transcriptional regulator, cyclic AMP receptor protein